MSLRSLRAPSYRLHRPTQQAVVTLNGRDIYLGKHGTPESRAEYDRLIGEWLTNGRRLAAPSPASPGGSDLTVAEMLLAYFGHVDGYYVKHGRPSPEARNIKHALLKLRDLYGHTLARDFGPKALKAVRQSMIEDGLCRNEVNKRTGRVVRCFKWAVGEEMVPASVHHGLQAVAGLRKGRTDVRESEPVKPVPDAKVDAVRPYVARQVWAMVELQRLTAMRPGEVVIMTSGAIDRSGPVWVYTPETHKMEHRDRSRMVFLGPRAQEILRPWLKADPDAYLFSPAEAREERFAAVRAKRKSKVQPSQKCRRKPKAKRRPGLRYTTNTYYFAVREACRRAFPFPVLAGLNGDRKALKAYREEHREDIAAWDRDHSWHPNQLRHTAATRLRKVIGIEAARVVLGHSDAGTTLIYAEEDAEKARAAMAQIG